MGSKMIGFRCPEDLAKEFVEYCEGADKTSGEVLRKMVDDLLYPGSGRERLEASLGRKLGSEAGAAPGAELDEEDKLFGVKATQWVADQVNAQIKMQLQETLGDMVDQHLELVQVDHGMTEAEKRHYDGAMADLGGRLAKLKTEVDPILTERALDEIIARDRGKR